ncbi:BON domain-containing protein [Thiohalomonas denitrificans]|uniref:Osmotically-inducible protein OsmY, contains BON domain n=1 Tax=Thiohalomonas denitrificans TaxID=415747 RepID=A0A1G5PQV2_9GAMM|nr:BON domain-containing protein [Thiohalomonas denitrificans]SCZ51833.1 Osmotically-inducible protein OsmY, contains BON domain [Thiohalomonas denitrificans]
MNAEHSWVKEVRAALEREPRINLHRNPIDVDMDGETLVLRGETDSIAAKRLAFRTAAAIVPRVSDHLRLVPTEARDDGAIKDSIVLAFEQESAFRDCNIAVSWHNQHEVIRATQSTLACTFHITIREGTVTLEGAVESLSHRRLAEALTWWSTGVTDVVDRVRIVPEQPDSDYEITDAANLVLEKDPLVHNSQIHVVTTGGTVTLEGLVREEQEREMAEMDVWFLEGVGDVVNRLEVRQGMPAG